MREGAWPMPLRVIWVYLWAAAVGQHMIIRVNRLLFPRRPACHLGKAGIQYRQHVIGDRERGGETGGLDAVEIDEAGHAMGLGTGDDEIGGRFGRGGDLGPNGGIARLE